MSATRSRSSGTVATRDVRFPRGATDTCRTSGTMGAAAVMSTARPASTNARWRLSSLVSRGGRGSPSFIFSMPLSSSSIPISAFSRRTAMIAASLRRLASSAPLYPTVSCAVRRSRALSSNSSSPSEGICFPRLCTCRIFKRLPSLGRPSRTTRSKRPARNRAGSRVLRRLVAPMTSTFSRLESNPSISTSNCKSPCSRSSLSAP
mmetsp:Transcript_21753/g.47790  ORF Transcript_21753/g.47790 Transcript_21753/m.47790 type:complete len:205 (+) Transcript_21753:308-922(+)